jgi:hypothetical protein
MVVLGLSLDAGAGSLLNGLTGFTGDTGDADNNDDLGEVTAAFGATGKDWAAAGAELGIPNAGTGADSGAAEGAALGWAATASDLAPTTPASLDTASVSSESASALVVLAADLCTVTAGFAFVASSSAEVRAGFCAALEIKEAAKTTPAVSKAERVKLIFSPKA